MIVVRRKRVTVTERLVLVEEVRVKKVPREVREPKNVKLRREEVVVDRHTQNREDQ